MGKVNVACEHNWKVFRDPKLVHSGFLSFFCTRCLELRKKKVVYKEEQK